MAGVLQKVFGTSTKVRRLGNRVLRRVRQAGSHPYGRGGQGGNMGGMASGAGSRVARHDRHTSLSNGAIRRIAEMSPILWAIRRTARQLVVQQPWEIVADTDSIKHELNRWREIETANLNPFGVKVRFESETLPAQYQAMGHEMLFGVWQPGLNRDQKVRRIGVIFDQVEARVQQDQLPAISKVRGLLEKPNDDSETSLLALLDRVIDDVLVFDASAIVKNPDKAKTSIAELYELPGDEIWRYINEDRSTPKPPNPAYQWRSRDNRLLADFRNNELIYIMDNPQADGYGRSGIDSAVHIILAALKADKSNIDLLDHSVIPPVIFDLGPELNDVQGKEWIDRFGARLFGANRFKYGAVWGLPDFKIEKFAEKSSGWDMGMQRWAQYCIGIMCMQYGFSPQDIGVVLDFHRTTAEVQHKLTQSRGVRSLFFLLESFLNGELVRPMTPNAHVRMQYKDLEEPDQASEDELWKTRVTGGAASINDWRASFDGAPIPGGDGYFRDSGMGMVPVLKMGDVIDEYGAVLDAAGQGGGGAEDGALPVSGLIPGLSQEQAEGVRAKIGNPFADMEAAQKNADVMGEVLQKQHSWINQADTAEGALRRLYKARRWIETDAPEWFPTPAVRDEAAAWLDDCRDALCGGTN